MKGRRALLKIEASYSLALHLLINSSFLLTVVVIDHYFLLLLPLHQPRDS
jgi:hypothetical protein